MCDICWQSPCHPRCPNAPEPPVAHRCVFCGCEIYEGEGYYDLDGEPWCEVCVKQCHTYAEREEEV